MKFSELITQYKNEATANKNHSEKLLSLNDRQLTWQPAARKWSIMQCLEHMNRVARHYLKTIDTAAALKTDEDKEFKPGWLGGMLAKSFAVIPPKRKFKTTRAFSPANDMNPKEVLKDFFSNQEKMQLLLESAAGCELNKNKVPSPSFSFIKFRLGDVINMDAKHTARHLYQAECVMKAEGFPK